MAVSQTVGRTDRFVNQFVEWGLCEPATTIGTTVFGHKSRGAAFDRFAVDEEHDRRRTTPATSSLEKQGLPESVDGFDDASVGA